MKKNQVYAEFYVLEFQQYILSNWHVNEGGSINLNLTQNLKKAVWYDNKKEAEKVQEKIGGYVRKMTAVVNFDKDVPIRLEESTPFIRKKSDEPMKITYHETATDALGDGPF